MVPKLPLLLSAALLSTAAYAAEVPERGGLIVSILPAPPSGPEVRISQPLGRRGPTSIRYRSTAENRKVSKSVNPTDPNDGKFFVKDRDLGQTFTVPAESKPFRLEAVTLRVGPVAAETDGKMADARERGAVFLQIFEVSGKPVINDNGTTGDVQVSEAYKKPATRAMADDYITGETYTTKLVASGGKLPAGLRTGETNTPDPTPESKGSILKFDITATGGVILEPGRTYAFLVGFENSGPEMALPLDNYDFITHPNSPQLLTGPYGGGHAIRREGRVANPWEHKDLVFSTDPSYSRFPDSREDRLKLSPGTFGRPDVDTYRDLVFWITGSDVK